MQSQTGAQGDELRNELMPQLSPLRSELLQWFKREAPSLAPAYEGAILLLSSPGFPGRLHFISHAIRDIAGRLVFALDSNLEGSRVQYENQLDVIQKHWAPLDQLLNESGPPANIESVSVSLGVARLIDQLVTDHQKRRTRPSEYELLFRRLINQDPSRGAVDQRLVSSFKDLRDWFMKFTHLRSSSPPEIEDGELIGRFEAFESTLHSFVGNFFTGTNELDAILQQANQCKPTNEQVDAAVPHLASPQHARYFFDRLNNPFWIMPLKARGFFEHPPEPEETEGGVQCHTWPQSRYLFRMASTAPELVSPILAQLKTKNWVVARDAIDAAKVMPSHSVVPLVRGLGEMVKDLPFFYELEEVGRIALQLIEGGYSESALELASIAFDRGSFSGLRHHNADHHYLEGLKIIIPQLVTVKTQETIKLLLKWMHVAIAREQNTDESEDYSYIWRPAIEDHEQNNDFGFAAKFVGIIRDALETTIRGGHLSFDQALKSLKPDSSVILRRLQIHLVAEFAHYDVGLARLTMLNEDLFTDYRVKHEYARLMRLRFTLLTPEEQTKWLSWVDAGPQEDQHDSNEDDKLNRANFWKFHRLHWIKDHISDGRLQFYETMLAENGIPELADLNVYSGGVEWGSKPPFSHGHLADMGFEEAVSTIAKWRPDPRVSKFGEPSIDGLNNTFRDYLKGDPVAFSAKSQLIENLPAPYVRSFVEAMQEAVGQGTPVLLWPVLDLCKWILSRPVNERTVPSDSDTYLIDKNWQWCRDAVAGFIATLCSVKNENKNYRFSLEYREKLWELITSLLDCPTTSYVLSDNAESDPRTTDWPMLALNSPRGKAMSAVFAYANWVAESLESASNPRSPFPGGFKRLPEVRAILEEQLTRRDDCFTGRAYFGWRFSLLYWLDASWLRDHAGRIFNLSEFEQNPRGAFGWAAWNTFLFATQPHIEYYKILRDQFAYAVDQATKVKPPEDSRDKPFDQLATHLLLVYGRGNLGEEPESAWNADNKILQKLISESQESIRLHALEFAGRSLGNAVDLSKGVIKRFQFLWERYWRSVGIEDSKRNPTKCTFGWWFSCKILDPDWALSQFEEFLAQAPKAHADREVLKRLAEIANQDPFRSVRILKALVEGDEENWRIYSWKEEAKKVLALARSSGRESRELADQVIDRLGRRGYLEFRDLLSTETRSGAGRT